MAQPSVSPTRLDPYKNYKLTIRVGPQVYTGKMLTGLVSSNGRADYRPGNGPINSPRKITGRDKFDPITLNRGITNDQSFANWASSVWSLGPSLGSEVSLTNFRKDIYLEFANEAGQNVVSYKIAHGWLYERQILHNPRIIQHNLNLQPGRTLQEKLAAIFHESLDRSSGRG